MKDLENKKVELKDEALDWVNGGYLTDEAQAWVNRNYQKMIELADDNQILVDFGLSIVKSNDIEYDVAYLKSEIHRYTGIDVSHLD